ncbi:hypothetical protein D3C72_1289850 [compost metagenome]
MKQRTDAAKRGGIGDQHQMRVAVVERIFVELLGHLLGEGRFVELRDRHVLGHGARRSLSGHTLLADVLQAQLAFLLQGELLLVTDVGEHAGRATIGDDNQGAFGNATGHALLLALVRDHRKSRGVSEASTTCSFDVRGSCA